MKSHIYYTQIQHMHTDTHTMYKRAVQIYEGQILWLQHLPAKFTIKRIKSIKENRQLKREKRSVVEGKNEVQIE